mmetsp:Transcript_4878/g.14526  ORF Transcript_4878/g.14526 Transcript_4878/m.14526 type:complete len:348 (+) Transcript_4878:68-1111(+)
MSEPTKDTAIDIAPKTQPTQGRVPKIVAEINRVASRVRDRNKKEEDHDAEVLENDAPTEITRIVRENTHPDKDKPQGRFAQISSRVIPLLVPIINCVFLARIDARASTLGVDARLGILSSPPPPPPYSPPPPTVITQESMEYKTIVWDASSFSYQSGETSFTEVMEREGVSEDEISGCSFALGSSQHVGVGGWVPWSGASTSSRTCVLMILADKLLRDDWRLMNVPEYWNDEYGSALFTRTNYTTPTVAVSTAPAPASAQVEHKAVFWSNYGFKSSAENEGVSTTDMNACSTSNNSWAEIPSLDQKCLVELLLSTLEKDNWTLATAHAFGFNNRGNAYHFTRPVQTS